MIKISYISANLALTAETIFMCSWRHFLNLIQSGFKLRSVDSINLFNAFVAIIYY